MLQINLLWFVEVAQVVLENIHTWLNGQDLEMLTNLKWVKVVLGQECKHNRFDRGITILEALVSTAIIAIGFIAIFQMVQYSIRSIDVSSERTKSGLLISMVAEDLISEKNASSPTSKVSLTDY